MIRIKDEGIVQIRKDQSKQKKEKSRDQSEQGSNFCLKTARCKHFPSNYSNKEAKTNNVRSYMWLSMTGPILFHILIQPFFRK